MDNSSNHPAGPSLEDFVLLQSSLEELRSERDELLSRIRSFEGQTQEQTRLAESQLREARAQVEALKTSAQKVRERLEAEARVSAARATEAERNGELQAHARAELEDLYQQVSAQLEEAAARIVDLETESLIYTGELTRISEEHAAASSRVDELSQALEEHAARIAAAEQQTEETRQQHASTAASLTALQEQHSELDNMCTALLGERDELQSQIAQLRREVTRLETALQDEIEARRGIEAQRAAEAQTHETERQQWMQLAAQREAELIGARDDVARQLEAEQSAVLEAHQRVDELTAKLCNAEARATEVGNDALRLSEEIEALRQEQDRQRRIFEDAARQREEQHRSQSAGELARFEGEIEQREAQLRELQHQLLRLREELQTANAAALQTRQELVRLRSELEQAQLQMATQQTAIESARAQVSLLEAGVLEREAESQRLAARLGNTEQLLRERESTIHRLGQEAEAAREQFEAELGAVRGAVDTQRSALEAARSQIHALETRAAEGDALRTRLGGQIVELEQAIHDGAAQLLAARRDAEAAALRAADELQLVQTAAAEKQANLEAARSALAAELGDAQSRLSDLNSGLETAQRRIASIDAERTELQSRTVALSGELEAQKNNVGQLQGALTAERQAHASERTKLQGELRQANSRWQEEAQRLANERDQLQARGQDLSARIAALDEELTGAHHRNESLTKALGEARAQLDTRQRDYESLERESLQLLETHETATRELQQRAEERDAQWQQAMAATQERQASVEAELQSLRDQLEASQAEQGSRDQQLARISAELDAARHANEEQQAIIEHLQGQTAELAAQLQQERQNGAEAQQRSAEQLAEAASQLAAAREHAAQEAQRRQEDVRDLTQGITNARHEIAELQAARDQVVAELTQNQAAAEAQAAELAALRQRLSAAEESLNLSQESVGAQSARAAALAAEQQALQSRSEQLQAEVTAQQQTIAELHSERQRLEAVIAEQQQKLQASQSAVLSLEQAAGEREATLSELTARLEASQQDLKQLRLEAERGAADALSRISEIEATTSVLRDERDALLASQSELQQLRDNLRQDLIATQTALQSAEAARDASLTDSDSRVQQLSRDLKTRSSELEATRRDLAIVRETKEMAERSVATAENARKRLAIDIEQLREQLAKADNGARQQMEGLREELSATLQSRDAAIATLQQAVEQATQALEREQLARQAVDQQLHDSQARFAELQQANAAAGDTQLGAVEAQLRTAQEQITHWQQTVAAAESRAQQAEEAAARAARDLEALQEESVGILISQEQMGEQIAALSAERTTLQQQLEQLNSDLQTARSEHEQAQQALTAKAAKTGSDDEADRRALFERIESLSSRVRQMEQASNDLRQALQEATQARDYATNQLVQRDREHQAVQQQLARSEDALKQYRAEAAALRVELTHRTSGAVAEIERERNELKTQVDNLSALLRQQGIEQAALSEQHQSALRDLNSKIEDLVGERQGAQLRLAELDTLTAQLQGECDRLRRERSSGDEARRFKGEVARLETRLEEIERQRTDAAQNHSAAVAGYMVELNQRSEALLEREQQYTKVSEELVMARQKLDDATAQLSSLREERSELERQLDELRKAAAAGGPRPVFESRMEVVANPEVKTPDVQAGALPEITGPVTLIHIDETKDLREALRGVVTQIPNSRYLNTLDVDRLKTTGGTVVLAVNLLNRVHDPLAAIRSAIVADDMIVFAYCADAQFGFAFGEVTFFVPPLDPDRCIRWLAKGRQVHRMLAASNNVEMTSSLRSALTKVRCSASVALDLRQVTDLVPMINPEAVLIDLALPRAEGLRLVSRIRSDAKTKALPLGIVLPDKAGLAEFRQHAPRAARESSLNPAQLAQALAGRLGLAVPAAPAAKAAG